MDLVVEQRVIFDLLQSHSLSKLFGRQLSIQFLFLFFLFLLFLKNEFDETGFAEEVENLLISPFVFWVQVELERSFEKSWLLRNNGDGLSNLLQVDLANIDSIDLDLAATELNDSGKCECNGTLTSSSPSDNTNLFAAFDFHRELLEHFLSGWSVLELHFFELDGSLAWPCLLLVPWLVFSLLRNIEQFEALLN